MSNSFKVEAFVDNEWMTLAVYSTRFLAANFILDRDERRLERIPRRVVDAHGAVILHGRWSVPPVAEPAPPEPFWVVASLDKPGPVERGEAGYARHTVETTAIQEANRLADINRGRMGVFRAEPVLVVGWTERRVTDLRSSWSPRGVEKMWATLDGSKIHAVESRDSCVIAANAGYKLIVAPNAEDARRMFAMRDDMQSVPFEIDGLTYRFLFDAIPF